MSTKSQGHYLTLAKSHSDFKIRTCFSQNLLSFFNQISYDSLQVNGNETLC